MDSYSPLVFDKLLGLEAESLEGRINFLVNAYQSRRNSLLAWLVVSYAQLLSRHPDFDDGDEKRCAYRRLALQWRLLARSGEAGRNPPPYVVAEEVL